MEGEAYSVGNQVIVQISFGLYLTDRRQTTDLLTMEYALSIEAV